MAPPPSPKPAPAPLVNTATSFTPGMSAPTIVGTPTPAQIKALKEYVIATATHIATERIKIANAMATLASLKPADVNAVVVPGYPPPNV